MQSDLAPGMEQIIEAGDTLVIKDETGQEFAVTAREHPATMEFLKAFDQWFAAKEGNKESAITDAYWFELKARLNNLPMHIQRQFPSFKQGGVVLRAHGH